jgi:hypothetical protein
MYLFFCPVLTIRQDTLSAFGFKLPFVSKPASEDGVSISFRNVGIRPQSMTTSTAKREGKRKVEPFPARGRGGLQGREMLRIPYCLDSGLTDGGKVVSLKHRPRSTL